MPEIIVLLVDDVELFLELEKTFLQREGFRILLARNGIEAIALAKEHRPDLVFMDLHMPEMDGDEACRRIKADPEISHTPVVMVTQGSRPTDLERCRQSGCDDFLLKPIKQHHFAEAAHRFLHVRTRVAPRAEARISIRYGEEQNLLSNYSVNLSTGGVFIETEDILLVDSALRIKFVIPGVGREIVCTGRVAWVNHPEKMLNKALPVGLGLQFLDLNEDDRDAIREYIKTRDLQPSW
ncbi:TIGR02266 family protein [Geopsychrobacter electrodiphilus]|uniref:TIGR02266 family protein n=1 Tax=Geopsychrobacter electrodiphilus TaxID=225196 RepID=UPI000476DD5D|nr:TIGR02266 family protein [Geopsychrobacter electrodiphilus]